jgi:soluble lytic murein transglycosylase-like protein
VRFIVILLFSFSLLGCNGQNNTSPVPEPSVGVTVPTDPDERLYEQMRSGAFQSNLAVEALIRALDAARNATSHSSGKDLAALQQVSALLDLAGASLNDYPTPPPPLDQFKKQSAKQEQRRANAAHAVEAAEESVGKAASLLLGVRSSPTVEQLRVSVAAAHDALSAALSAFSGTPA